MNKTSDSILQEKLPVMESFYTIQGEGFHQGRAAYFIRLAGCDVGCVWCDVKESWEAGSHPEVDINELVQRAGNTPAEVVVITGGEPLMYNLTALTQALRANKKRTHVETSGAYPLSGDWDWICFSPKKFKAPREEFFAKAHELKVVIYHKSDFAWAEELSRKMNPNARLFLQPEWSKSTAIISSVVDFVKENPRWEISLQIHKFMNVP